MYTIYAFLGGGFGVRSDLATVGHGDPLVFAHRGMTEFSNENSMEGFMRCEAQGFNALEIDVRKTNDDRLVIFHDRSLKRRLGLQEDITEVNLEYLKDYFLLHNHEPTKYKIVTLDEVLVKLDSSMVIYLDIKDVNKTIADSVLWLIEKHHAYQSVAVADQSVVFLSYLKFKDPRVITVLERFSGHHTWVYPFIPKKFKPDYYASFLREVDNDHVEFLKDNNLLERMIVYGVDKTNLADVHTLGIRNVIIDYDSTLLPLHNIEQALKMNHHRTQH